MTNIVKTNNQQLRLAQLSVGLLSTLRIAFPMVPQSATNVEVIVTSGDTHNAYTATFDSTNHWWLCDIDASQFPTVGRQKYEVAYKIAGDQFWDGQGWIEIVNATTSGITPAPLPDPYRYVVVTVNGYGATEADGAVRIPKLNIGTEDPSETTGYIEGDVYFNQTSGAQWVLCTVAGELTWVKCDSGVISVNGKVGAVSLDANDVGAVPFVVDSRGNKTAVTIGSRKSGEPVGPNSIANGSAVVASGNSSHAEGSATTASGSFSHAEGSDTTASSYYSHAEGIKTTAAGNGSHAEGYSAHTKIGDSYAFAWNGDEARSVPYESNGRGTFNINPKGGLGGFYIGEQTLAGILANKADRASLAPEYSATSAYSVGTIVYYGGNIYQCLTAIADGGEEWNAEHWELRKLDDFFTASNSLLTGTIDARLPYPLYAVPSTGLLKDRAINTTSIASVTVPDNFTDLLIRASVASSLSVTMPSAIATKYGDTFPGEAGEYLITITKTGAAEAYVRTIKLEVANA